MIHARIDYARFQDPGLEDPSLVSEGSTPIAEDEPVLLFRAKDQHFIFICSQYRAVLEHQPGAEEMMEALDNHIIRATRWRDKNGFQRPDMPAGTALPLEEYGGPPESQDYTAGYVPGLTEEHYAILAERLGLKRHPGQTWQGAIQEAAQNA